MVLETRQCVLNPVLRKNKQWTQWLLTIIASICFFTTGMNFGWSSPSLEILQSANSPFSVTITDVKWIPAMMQLGSTLGPLLGACMVRYLGPKKTAMLSSIPYIIGYVLIIIATKPIYLYFFRFLCGVANGLVFTTIPNYISEISENHNRGSLISVCCVVLHMGSFVILCFAPYLSLVTTAEICCVFPVLALALLPFMPDSPYYLMRYGKEKESIQALKWLRQRDSDLDLQDEIDRIKKSVKNNFSIVKCIKLIKERPNPKGLMIVMLVLFAQQLSGATAISSYMQTILKDAQAPMRPEVAVMIASLIGNIVDVVPVFFMDRLGRRPLLFISSIGCGAVCGVLGLYFQAASMYEISQPYRWLAVVAVLISPGVSFVGLLVLPNIIPNELFSSDFKEVAIGLMNTVGAILSATVIYSFMHLSSSVSMAFSFFLCSGLTFLLLGVNYFVVPETKNKTPLEIQELLLGSKNRKTNDKTAGSSIADA